MNKSVSVALCAMLVTADTAQAKKDVLKRILGELQTLQQTLER